VRKREQYKCPPEFQERLTRVGGVNRYGLPNFIIVWGQSWTVRRGGTWEQDDGTYFRGYRNVLEDGRPCWILKKWNAPEIYGSPALWFMQNREESVRDTPPWLETLRALARLNGPKRKVFEEMVERVEAKLSPTGPDSGLQILGDFPWRGCYETVQPFVWKGLVNGRMVVERMPLNSMILDLVVPIVLKSQEATFLQRKAAIQEMEARKDRDMLGLVEAKRHDANMAFRGPVSFARQGCRTSLVDRKVYAIEKHWDQAMKTMRGRGLGISLMN
jgi:hypothetical protein